MDRLVLNTRHGPLFLVGRIHTGAPRPSLLVIGGAFPPKDYKHELIGQLPGANVVVGSLPGMWSDSFEAPSCEAFSEAFDEAIALLLRDQPVVTYGISTGALVTLGLRAPNIRRHVAEEPFFATAGLTAFIAFVRKRFAEHPGPQLSAFMRDVFGIDETTVENRDYSHLLDRLAVPADIVVGQAPLEDGEAQFTSFTSTADRARLRAHPQVTLHEGPAGSGHYIDETQEGRVLVRRLLLTALHEASPS